MSKYGSNYYYFCTTNFLPSSTCKTSSHTFTKDHFGFLGFSFTHFPVKFHEFWDFSRIFRELNTSKNTKNGNLYKSLNAKYPTSLDAIIYLSFYNGWTSRLEICMCSLKLAAEYMAYLKVLPQVMTMATCGDNNTKC